MEKLDFIMTTEPWDKEDITYCTARDCTRPCWRRYSQIDWELPKHQYYGVSMSDFAEVCASYQRGEASHD